MCIYANRLLGYFWAGPAAISDDKRFLSCPIISFVSIVCHRSHAGHNDLRLRVVSPDLDAMLIASICLAALDCVDIFANAMVTKHMEDEGFDSCLCDWQTESTNGIGSQAVTRVIISTCGYLFSNLSLSPSPLHISHTWIFSVLGQAPPPSPCRSSLHSPRLSCR